MRYILVVILISLHLESLLGQDTTLTRDELRAMASESFSKSDFTTASVYYKRLLDYYPKDPAYHFYLGACKTEMGEDLTGAIRLLEFAADRFNMVEVYYYQGAAYQKLGRFENAIAAYNRYSDRASKKDISRRQLNLHISECRSGQKLTTKEPVVQTVTTASEGKDTIHKIVVPEEGNTKEQVNIEKDNPVIYPPKSTADESGYMEMLNEALRIQMKSDSLVRETERLRREIAGSNDWNMKKRALAEINVLQTEADNLQNNANAIYSKARGLELKFVHANSQTRNIITDSLVVSHLGKDKQTTDNTGISKNEIKQDEEHTDKVLYDFRILSNSPYSEINPISIDTTNHVGICYKIQVGVFGKPVEFQQFKGLTPISAEKIAENGFTRYYAGIFSHIKETELALEMVRNYGFKEAFIVSFYNGKKISLIRAREIEQMLKTN
jgi:tetratricopeptide (TPR) repeat protein